MLPCTVSLSVSPLSVVSATGSHTVTCASIDIHMHAARQHYNSGSVQHGSSGVCATSSRSLIPALMRSHRTRWPHTLTAVERKQSFSSSTRRRQPSDQNFLNPHALHLPLTQSGFAVGKSPPQIIASTAADLDLRCMNFTSFDTAASSSAV